MIIKTLATKLYIQLLKLYCNILIFADGNGPHEERIKGLGRAMLALGPISFVAGTLELWYEENTTFTLFAVGFVGANAVIGGIVHLMNNRFRWETFFLKTLKMVVIITGVYFVLEGIISPLGSNPVTTGFKAAFQVATLLYPGSKILKNFYIWSDGEHPPKYIMERVYNFQENGDLKEFMEGKKGGYNEENTDV